MARLPAVGTAVDGRVSPAAYDGSSYTPITEGLTHGKGIDRSGCAARTRTPTQGTCARHGVDSGCHRVRFRACVCGAQGRSPASRAERVSASDIARCATRAARASRSQRSSRQRCSHCGFSAERARLRCARRDATWGMGKPARYISGTRFPTFWPAVGGCCGVVGGEFGFELSQLHGVIGRVGDAARFPPGKRGLRNTGALGDFRLREPLAQPQEQRASRAFGGLCAEL